MEVRDEGILYRRVVWRPDDAQWWTCQGEACWPERACVKLRRLQTHERPRRHPDGTDVAGTAGTFERGLSCNYTPEPDAKVVLLAAQHDLSKYRVIGFRVSDVRSLKLAVTIDPIPGDDTHALIVPEPYTLLTKAPTRSALIDMAWEVATKEGHLLELYRDIKMRALAR